MCGAIEHARRVPAPAAIRLSIQEGRFPPMEAKTEIPIALYAGQDTIREASGSRGTARLEGDRTQAPPERICLSFGSESGNVTRLANFIELEQACCPFLTFRIDVWAGGTVWLELTGPPAAQEIIRELIPKETA
jgi:hypothetical protein